MNCANRFESRLEALSRSEDIDAVARANLQRALNERERMFIGTVHAFCGRILREYALDAGLPLDFTELDEVESKALRAQSWHAYLDRNMYATGRAREIIAGVSALGVDVMTLTSAFEQYERYRDLTFDAPHSAKPPHESVRQKLVAFIERGYALRNAALQGLEDAPRDELQKTMDRLWNGYHLRSTWNDAADFARDASTLLVAKRREIVQKRWGESKIQKAAAKSFAEDVDAFATGALADWFASWWAHVYPHVISLFSSASDWALHQRRRSGQLGFDDLLTETARLLRNNAPARQVVGERWRYLLVDEFQDTDPVQAEICFLIASDVHQGNNWRTVKLREGSLFVVGDPKQSIYRFRRADLATYRLVESRMATCGRVERLTRNFRSVAGIGKLVNTHFQHVFSAPDNANATPLQAPFAEFIAARTANVPTAPAVSHYIVGPAVKVANDDIIAEDAQKLASWIATRCGANGERSPQDFLILTTNKRELAQYAHELALRNVPVAVSGATSAVDEVVTELLIVLRALSDPANAVAVIAALEGWCFGCSHDDLWRARERHVDFHITHRPAGRSTSVARDEIPEADALSVVTALHQLHEWWTYSQQLLPAALVERILDDSGLLLLASSGDMGERNGGQLLQMVAMLRAASSAGSNLPSAIEAIEGALTEDDNDPALRVGRTDAVRVMNLHKAKGLEAPVVILAAPVDIAGHEPIIATWRDAKDEPQAAMIVTDDRGVRIAQPAQWDARVADESARQNAERDRLLYVAVTRAEDELVVARRATYVVGKATRHDASAWAPLVPVLDVQSTALALIITQPPGRRTLDISAAEMASRVAQAAERLQLARAPRYELINVTEVAKRTAIAAAEDGEPMLGNDAPSSAMQNGSMRLIDARAFGSLMHRAIEGALRGRDDATLREYMDAIAWHEFPVLNDAERVTLLDSVFNALQQARRSEAWTYLTANGATPLAELSVARFSTGDSPQLIEGVMDAIALTSDGWVVVDWKSSTGNDTQWASQLPTYPAQARTYLETLAVRTGMTGREQVVRIRGEAP